MTKTNILLLILAAVALAAMAWQSQTQRTISHQVNPAYENAGYPFSETVSSGGWVFVSGTLGTVPGGSTLVSGGIGPETRQTMENIKAALARENIGMDRIVKCTVMLANMAEWPAFNKIYATFFEGNYPARSAFGASGLALNARVEIECTARR